MTLVEDGLLSRICRVETSLAQRQQEPAQVRDSMEPTAQFMAQRVFCCQCRSKKLLAVGRITESFYTAQKRVTDKASARFHRATQVSSGASEPIDGESLHQRCPPHQLNLSRQLEVKGTSILNRPPMSYDSNRPRSLRAHNQAAAHWRRNMLRGGFHLCDLCQTPLQ